MLLNTQQKLFLLELLDTIKYVKYSVGWGPLWAEIICCFSNYEITFGVNSCVQHAC